MTMELDDVRPPMKPHHFPILFGVVLIFVAIVGVAYFNRQSGPPGEANGSAVAGENEPTLTAPDSAKIMSSEKVNQDDQIKYQEMANTKLQ